MKHNDDGAKAEAEVCKYLKENGFKIIDTNWKTRWCEIDVVADRNSCIYFVEVKYRTRSAQGSGFDYITASKLKQMTFAAEFWIYNHKEFDEYVLSAAEVIGPDYQVNFLEEV